MKAFNKIAVLAAASAAAVSMATPAFAADFIGGGPGSYSTSTVDDTATFDFAYNAGGGGVRNAQWTFQTVSDRTGTYSFQYDIDGYSAYFIARANASAFSGGDSQSLYNTGTYGGYNQSGTFTLDLVEGQAYGIQVGGSNFDSDSRVQGTFRLTSAAIAPGAVPEPATWAMMILGMGAVGFAMRRRTKGVTTTVKFV